MIEKIEWDGEVFALTLRREYEPEGVNFITPRDNFLSCYRLYQKPSQPTPSWPLSPLSPVIEY